MEIRVTHVSGSAACRPRPLTVPHGQLSLLESEWAASFIVLCAQDTVKNKEIYQLKEHVQQEGKLICRETNFITGKTQLLAVIVTLTIGCGCWAAGGGIQPKTLTRAPRKLNR